MHLGQGNPGAGHLLQGVAFENVSPTACRLFGYPGLQMLDSSGRRMATHVSRDVPLSFNGNPAQAVVLNPRGNASFDVIVAAQTGFGDVYCPASARVAVTPPGDRRAITVDWQIQGYGGGDYRVQCGDLDVSFVYAGTPIGD